MKNLFKQSQNKPPRFAEWLLSLILIDERWHTPLGDFEEFYHQFSEESSVVRARFWYWGQVLKLIPQKIAVSIYWRCTMLSNYIKIALRNLKRNFLYSFINVFGLAVGIACCLLILLYIQHELSYDRHHEHANRLYRVAISMDLGKTAADIPTTGYPTGPAMVNDYPEVVDMVRLNPTGNWYIKYGDQTFKETRLVYSDPNVFDMFTISLLQGDSRTALTQPNTIVVSNVMAEKYFGTENPIGKTLNLDETADYLVTGVFQEIPERSHFHFDFFASISTIENNILPIWLSMNFYTYLKLANGADPKALESKFPAMVDLYCGPEFQQYIGSDWEVMKKAGNRLDFFLQPITDIHLHSHLNGEIEPNGDIKYVIIFSAIAIFILLIACINFMNLSTARSTKRAREVGIRKVVGSYRSQLVGQFLSETVVMSIIALVLAVIFVQIMLPHFNNLAGKELSAVYLKNGHLSLSLLLIVLFVGLIAGSYPAFFLSSFRPVSVLQQKLTPGSQSRLTRSVLVVFQFTTSIILIIGTIVVFKQLNYIQKKDLGFNREQVLIINDAFILGNGVDAFKKEIMQNSQVVSASVSGFLPVTSNRNMSAVFPEGQMDEKTTPINLFRIDFDYVQTFYLHIIEGRTLSEKFASDSAGVILNEAAVKHFNWTDPIGKTIGIYVDATPLTLKQFTVVGVVKNFHFESLRERIGPLAMFYGQSAGNVSIRLKTEDLNETLQFVEKTWNRFAPGKPFEFGFLDDRFDAMYREEQRTGRIFGIFAVLAIFIGCMGLFGLAAFTAEQRTKEIGIRKVLGSSVTSLVLLLSKEFVKWVLIANLIAWPIAWFAMKNWLQDFSYRTDLTIWTFVISAGLALIVALITVSFQAIRAAHSDPVDILKYE